MKPKPKKPTKPVRRKMAKPEKPEENEERFPKGRDIREAREARGESPDVSDTARREPKPKGNAALRSEFQNLKDRIDAAQAVEIQASLARIDALIGE